MKLHEFIERNLPPRIISIAQIIRLSRFMRDPPYRMEGIFGVEAGITLTIALSPILRTLFQCLVIGERITDKHEVRVGRAGTARLATSVRENIPVHTEDPRVNVAGFT